jgi:hypothetical protein
MKRQLFMFLLLMVGFLVVSSAAFAQTVTSTVQGTVTDANGAAIPGATVHIQGETVERTVVTDAQGFYRLVELPAGRYTASVSHGGFATKDLQGIVLYLDQTAVVDVRLDVSARTESITVNDSTPLLDTTESALKDVINNTTIDSIPLNGRNYLDLLQLTPGVVVNSESRSDLNSRDTTGAVMGERAGNVSFLIDGLENNDDFHGGVFQAFTQDAIREFEVIDTGFKAEFGGGSAAIVNVVSKSGTNAIHGDAFLFARNDALDSSDVAKTPAPTLERYDYGGTIGLPIRRDKSWFFGSIEAVQQTAGTIFPPNVPAILEAGENFSQVPKDTDVRAFGKYTQQLSEHNQMNASFSWTRANLLHALTDPIALPSAGTNSLTNTWLANFSLASILSPRLVLDSSFNVRAQNFGQNQGLTLGTSYEVFFIDDGSSFDFGPEPGSIQKLDQRYYTGREVLSYLPSEKHSIKFGFEYIRTIANGTNGQDLQNVIVTTHPGFQAFGVNSFQIPQGIAFLTPQDAVSKLRNNGFTFFGQDDWRIIPSLTLSGGIRYDYDTEFDTKRDVAPRLGLAWSPDHKTVLRASWGLFFDRYRLGLAQSVPQFGGFNETDVTELDYPRLGDDVAIPFPGTLAGFAVLGGDPFFLNSHFGIPNGTLVTSGNIQQLTGMSPTGFASAVTAYLNTLGPALPVDFSPSTGFLRNDITGSFEDKIQISNPFRTPYNNTFTVGAQRQLTSSLSVSATYIRRSIRDILGVRITNLSPASAAAGGPITTDGGPIQRVYGPWYDGKYSALVLAVESRFAHHFQVQASYTYGKSTDDLLNPNLGLGVGAQGGGAVPTNNNDIAFDRGNSDLFIPHVFVGSGVYAFPFGFHLSGIFRATSGVYFSAVGNPIDYDGDGISSTRPPGTTRNEFNGPATINLDLRIEKSFRFADRFEVSPLVEFFNIANRANPALINAFWTNGAPGPDFGKVLVPTAGREIQMGMKFIF